MNKIKTVIGLAMLSLALTTQAQSTNSSPSFSAGLREIADAISSSKDWTVVAGAGRSTTGSKNLAFADVAYAFNDNVGAVVGYDYLWSRGNDQLNAVKGGLTLQATIHPLAFIGSTFATNIVGTPFVSALVATPKSGDNIGLITTAGINFDVYRFKNFSVDSGFQLENRTGQGEWNGNYLLIHLGLSRKF